MEIREVRPEEYGDAGRVTALAFHEFADLDDPDWVEYLEEIADIAGRVDRTMVLVAVEDGRVFGTATIEMDHTVSDEAEDLPPDTAGLRMVGVDPAARGRGLGRALVEATLDLARRRGKRVMVLRTTPRMKAAMHIYASLGFEPYPDYDEVLEDGFRLVGYRLDLSAGVSPRRSGSPREDRPRPRPRPGRRAGRRPGS